MQNSILVVTPQASFGELLRESLVETGRYRVDVVYRVEDGLSRCRRSASYQLVILDGDLPEKHLDQVVDEIRVAQPTARIAAIPPEVRGTDFPSPDLKVDGTLNKPFYLPSLPATIEQLISGKEPIPAEEEEYQPQAGLFEQLPRDIPELERLSADCEASGALLLQADAPYLGAGACAPGDWTDRLVDLLKDSWKGGTGDELVLYRARCAPEGTGISMIYALRQSSAWLLAVVFPETVSYSTARTRLRQAGIQAVV